MTEYILNADPSTYLDLWLDMVAELNYGENPNKEWFIEQNKSLQETGKFIVITAVKDGEVIGFCDCLLNNDCSSGKVIGYGMHLFMKPEHREGIETASMFKKMEDLSYEWGADIIQVQCFPEKRRFWERQDFKMTQFVMRRY